MTFLKVKERGIGTFFSFFLLNIYIYMSVCVCACVTLYHLTDITVHICLTLLITQNY